MSDENAVEAKEKKSRKKYDVDGKKFVAAWQDSNSAAEAAEKLGMPRNIVLARYALYKGKGVTLKKMDRKNPRRLDVDELNRQINGE